MASDTRPSSSAGWFPDPGGSDRQRWWDGTRWTDRLDDAPSRRAPRLPARVPLVALVAFAVVMAAAVLVVTRQDDGGGCVLSADDAALESLLALVPDTADNRAAVQVARLDTFLDHQGLELPDDRDDVQWAGQPSMLTSTPVLWAALQAVDAGDDALSDDYGIGIGDVRRSIQFGTVPEATEVLVGSFDPDAVAAAADDHPYWGERHETVDAHGERFHAWGDDDTMEREGATDIRQLGIGGRLWVTAGTAAFTRNTPTMEALLEACAGAAPTLADDDTYRGIGTRLDELDGAVNAYLTDEVVRGAEEAAGAVADDEAVEAAESLTYLRDVEAYGFADGPAPDGDDARIRLVIAASTDDAAAENVQRFTDHIAADASVVTAQPWAEAVEIEHIEADGRFVVVDLRAEFGSVVANALLRRDSLVIAED